MNHQYDSQFVATVCQRQQPLNYENARNTLPKRVAVCSGPTYTEPGPISICVENSEKIFIVLVF